MSASFADRGKEGESLFKKALEELEAKDFRLTFNRISDARTAGGRGVSVEGDFQAFQAFADSESTRNFLFEVKETQHSYRLAYGNFDKGQVARMRKRKLAGSLCYVLVYHAADKLWRYQELEFFDKRDATLGSWDLRSLPTASLLEILIGLFYTHV